MPADTLPNCKEFPAARRGSRNLSNYLQRTADYYLKATRRRVDRHTWKKIVEMAVTQASEGDRYARDWLTRVLLELPEQQGQGLNQVKLRAAGQVTELIRETVRLKAPKKAPEDVPITQVGPDQAP